MEKEVLMAALAGLMHDAERNIVDNLNVPKGERDWDTIVKMAGKLAAGGYKTSSPVRLLSIFAQLNGKSQKGYLSAVSLNPHDKISLFPQSDVAENGASAGDNPYPRLWKAFEQACISAGLPQIKEPEMYLETLLELMQKYTWCIPSSAGEDVSYFNYARVRAAVSACFAADEFAGDIQATLEGDDTPVCLLLWGDISGLQKFIYSLTSDGAAKCLRARSFYVQLLGEALAYRILHELNLPITNSIYVGGGGFQLLVPLGAERQLSSIVSDLTERLLIRSWNSPVPAGQAATASCGGELVGQGFEGLNIFDISDPTNPVLIKNLRMAADTTPVGCGSHTATLVPDLARGNLYVYNSASSGACPGIDIVKIPLADPASAVFLRREPSGRSCHDTGVILGDVNLAACAGGNGFTVWSFDPGIDPPAVGSLEDPIQLYSRTISGVSIGHSASFTWDGNVLIFGHEPGGGGQAQCQATSSIVNRSLFFFEAQTGTLLGTFVHPRPQTNLENCTWHNYNVVPSDKRYILVSGNYQSGISVVDFTNPAAAYEVAYADPAPLINPNNPAAIELGGDWSTYWYNGRIYESDITRGLIIWNLSDNTVAGAMRFDHLNPQTQMISFPFKGTAFGKLKAAANQQGFVIFGESAPDDNSGGGGEEDFGGEDHEH